MKVSIVGASGYIGGELLRLLLSHPAVEVSQVTSERFAGKFVHTCHPNLRKRTQLKFSSVSELQPADLLFMALPHGSLMRNFSRYAGLAERIIDTSADFRLKNPADYEKWYGKKHPAPQLLEKFVLGIPELHRAGLRETKYAATPGCMATASILGLMPIFREGLASSALVDAKIGSSAAGNKPSLSSHHPERSHAVRAFKLTMHRHTAELEQELQAQGTISFSAHAIELVRGISATCHVQLSKQLTDIDVWKAFRKHYGNEPFIRLVKDSSGIFRYPEPKILYGSNYCDIGFELDSQSNRLVVVSAIDNLMKGGAGQAMQCMNVMLGLEETAGLDFAGMHPI